MKPKPFATEATLCAAFLAWLKEEHPQLRAYSEWAGWDILVVYPEGFQLGIQAKLRLNAEVIGQALPSKYGDVDYGPDYRAVLVPEINGMSGIATRLGLVVFTCHRSAFSPGLYVHGYHDYNHRGRTPDDAPSCEWLDWNPRARHKLPPCETDAVAGSPCPVSLTEWKLGALAVIAELSIKGGITTKRMKELGVDPRRWIAGAWLVTAGERGERGLWVRGGACPAFDLQHPTAYALALEKARQAQAGEATA